jgi:hypothetical protein
MLAASKLFRALLVMLVCVLEVTIANAGYAPLPKLAQIDRAVTHYSQPRVIYDNAGDALASIERTRTERTPAQRSPLPMITRPPTVGCRLMPEITALAIAAAVLRRHTVSHRLIHRSLDDGSAALA